MGADMGLFRRARTRERDDVTLDIRFGHPGQCPTCHGHAVLDHLDLEDRVSRHKCFVCRTEWWVAEERPGVALPIKP